MKREIKFRGRCVNSGEFVYGDLIHGVGHKSGNVYILPNKINLAYVKHCDPLDGVKVDPDTVGEFIGLHDKNGKEIYEGDILYGQILVTWRNDLASFALSKQGWAYDHYFGEAVDPGHTEVIGNIHQNLELLQP